MPTYFRVHPFVATAGPGEPGHPFFIPSSKNGRIDNAEYDTLYVSDSPAGAVAEVFGSYSKWIPAIFDPPPALPGAVMCLSTFEGVLSVVDLNDPDQLKSGRNAPSDTNESLGAIDL
jgi:hypothetical protein